MISRSQRGMLCKNVIGSFKFGISLIFLFVFMFALALQCRGLRQETGWVFKIRPRQSDTVSWWDRQSLLAVYFRRGFRCWQKLTYIQYKNYRPTYIQYKNCQIHMKTNWNKWNSIDTVTRWDRWSLLADYISERKLVCCKTCANNTTFWVTLP